MDYLQTEMSGIHTEIHLNTYEFIRRRENVGMLWIDDIAWAQMNPRGKTKGLMMNGGGNTNGEKRCTNSGHMIGWNLVVGILEFDGAREWVDEYGRCGIRRYDTRELMPCSNYTFFYRSFLLVR
jgi:hypothetical protein